METKNFICKGDTFFYGKGYIALPVHIDGLPETISVAGEKLQVKNSFHVSLVCAKNILEQLPNVEEAIIDEFCNFSKETDISFANYTSEFRFAEDKERKTLIVSCEIHNLEHFTDHLSEKLGVAVPYQPTHVTLYTLQQDIGIGLNSSQEMEQKSYPVEVPNVVVETITRSNKSSA